jgi:uncharacterized protein (TIGR02266 family)
MAEKKGRILVVGLERKLYLKLEPLLSRSLLSVDRVPSGRSGALVAGSAVFDLIVVRHPLPDMALGSFIERVHEPGALCGAAHLLVLTDGAQLAALRAQLPDGERRVLSIDEPAKLLEQVAARLLGVTPRVSTRILVRLRVKLGTVQRLVSCQTENLSDGGMLIRDDTIYPIGTRMDFELPLPGDRQPLRGEAEVVRYTVADVEGLQGVGLKFVVLKDDGHLRLKRMLGGKTAR